jgi:hypothetical protein
MQNSVRDRGSRADRQITMPTAVLRNAPMAPRFKYDPEHPLFKRPGGNSQLWRYLDFTKCVALLESQSLFVSRADQLGDPFEGSVSAATIELREQLRALADSPVPEQRAVQLKNIDTTLADASRYRQAQATFTYISCWHVSDGESAGMWAQYTPSGHGVAIQTTLTRLEDVLPREGPLEGSTLLYVGLVRYVDYRTEVVPDGNSLRRISINDRASPTSASFGSSRRLSPSRTSSTPRVGKCQAKYPEACLARPRARDTRCPPCVTARVQRSSIA